MKATDMRNRKVGKASHQPPNLKLPEGKHAALRVVPM